MIEEIEYNDGIEVIVANVSHEKYVDEILETIERSCIGETNETD